MSRGMQSAKIAAPKDCIICGGRGFTRLGNPCVAGCKPTPVYAAPAYQAVEKHLYDAYRRTIERHGALVKLEAPLASDIADGLLFEVGTLGAAPAIGDEIGLGFGGRLDIFTAQGRYFVLAYS